MLKEDNIQLERGKNKQEAQKTSISHFKLIIGESIVVNTETI